MNIWSREEEEEEEMVAIVDKINGDGGTNTMKQGVHHPTERIIQWLGGERAGTFELITPRSMFSFVF